jgi:hypothetical protein
MALAPVFLTVSLIGSVVRIGFHFLLLPRSFTRTLTVFTTTIVLVLASWIEFEKAFAMGTSDVWAHGFPPLEENHKCMQVNVIGSR